MLLVHGPLLGPSSLRRLDAHATTVGIDVMLPDLTAMTAAAQPHLAYTGRAIDAARGLAAPVAVIGHSGAGPFLPTICDEPAPQLWPCSSMRSCRHEQDRIAPPTVYATCSTSKPTMGPCTHVPDRSAATHDRMSGVRPIGPKLAEGRDSELFEHGRDRVLRIARDRRSLVAEAEVMRYVRSCGYPCPDVYDAGDGYLVMERLEGPTMMQTLAKPPFPLRRSGHLLAELHDRLHRISAPPGIRAAPLSGDRLVHCDLHPLNVMMTPNGPVVIDWANASAGDPAFDVADTWVLFVCGMPPMGSIDRLVVPIGRRVLLRAFLSGVDTVAARQAIPAAVEHRLADPNMSPEEQVRMRKLAVWAANG